MGTKNKTVTTNNSKQEVAPPSWALPGMQELASRITSIIPTMPGPQYTGDFVASPNATQYASLPLYQQASQMAGQAGGIASGAVDQLAGFTPTFDSWQTQAYDTMPAIQAATAPLMRQLTEQVLPGLQSSALASGAYGNNRMMELAPTMAISDAMRGMQEIAAGLSYADFQRQQAERLQGYGLMTERGLGTAGMELQAAGMMPSMLDTMMRMYTGSADLLSQSGNMQQGWDQAAINNELAKFDYAIKYPFQGLDTATQLLGALAGNYGTTTSSGKQTQTQSTGGLAPILGGAIGLGSMALGMPGVGSALSGMFSGGQGAPPSPMMPWLSAGVNPTSLMGF